MRIYANLIAIIPRYSTNIFECFLCSSIVAMHTALAVFAHDFLCKGLGGSGDEPVLWGPGSDVQRCCASGASSSEFREVREVREVTLISTRDSVGYLNYVENWPLLIGCAIVRNGSYSNYMFLHRLLLHAGFVHSIGSARVCVAGHVGQLFCFGSQT